MRACRLDRGFTVDDVARGAGVPARLIEQYENQQAAPTLETIVRLSHCLHVYIDYLLGRMDTMPQVKNTMPYDPRS